MLVLYRPEATAEQVAHVESVAAERGLKVRPIDGPGWRGAALRGGPGQLSRSAFAGLPGVRDVVAISSAYPLAATGSAPGGRRTVSVGGVTFGDGSVTVIAGPCAVESEEQILAAATEVAAHGAGMLRGGAFKPRSSPYTFQGLGVQGLRLLALARERTGLPIVTEAMDVDAVGVVEEYADVIQIGARSMQNFPLLRRVASSPRPVLLKRGPAATIHEWLLAAEYLLAGGNEAVILCERGVRTFADHTRNTLDLSVVPALRGRTDLPVIVDPSHATGHRDLVPPMALAALAAGADGVMVEVHPDPDRALSDGAQSLPPARFADLMDDVQKLAGALGRPVAGRSAAI